MQNAQGVARGLTFALAEDYTFAEMESALGKEMAAFPSVLLERNWAPEPERASEPIKESMRTWSPERKLAYANQQTLERIEKADAEARQREVADNGFDTSKRMKPAERLEIANSWQHEDIASVPEPTEPKFLPGSPAQRIAIAAAWKALGIDLDELEGSAPSLDRTRKAKTAMQRLSAANEAAAAKARKP
jgi:hypothetical protein